MPLAVYLVSHMELFVDHVSTFVATSKLQNQISFTERENVLLSTFEVSYVEILVYEMCKIILFSRICILHNLPTSSDLGL